MASGCAMRVCSIEKTVYGHKIHIRLSFVSCKQLPLLPWSENNIIICTYNFGVIKNIKTKLAVFRFCVVVLYYKTILMCCFQLIPVESNENFFSMLRECNILTPTKNTCKWHDVFMRPKI